MPDPRDPNQPEDDDARPVAVSQTGTQPWDAQTWGGPGAQDEAPAGAIAGPDAPFGAPSEPGPGSDDVEIERPGIELALGGVATVLAGSVFLPWYESGLGKVSGWASGTWGPVVFGLALVAVATVALRRLKVPVRFPVEHALVLEGIGWVAVVLLLVKNFLAPRPLGGELEIARPTFWVALGAAVGVALLGGMVSRSAPLVIRPGWLASSGGKMGAGLLAGAIVVGATFGLANDAGPSTPGTGSLATPPTTVQGFPGCMRTIGVPQPPSGIEPTSGFEPPPGGATIAFCQASFKSRFAPRLTIEKYRAALKTAGWTITTKLFSDQGAMQMSAEKADQCVTMTASKDGDRKRRSALNAISTSKTAIPICNIRERFQSRPGASQSPS